MRRAISIIAGLAIIFTMALALDDPAITGLVTGPVKQKTLIGLPELSEIKEDYFDNKQIIDDIKKAHEDISFTVSEKDAEDLLPYISIALFYMETEGFNEIITCDKGIASGWEEVKSRCKEIGVACRSHELYDLYKGCGEECDTKVYCDPGCSFQGSGESYPVAACAFGMVSFEEAMGYDFTGRPQLIEDMIAYYSVRKFNDIYEGTIPHSLGSNPSYLTDTVLAYRVGPKEVKQTKDRCGADRIEEYSSCLTGFAKDDILYVGHVLTLSLIFKDIDEQYALISPKRPERIDLKEPDEYITATASVDTYSFWDPDFSALSSGNMVFTPSFSFNLPYDLSEYDLIKDDVSRIYSGCRSSPYLEICIKEKLRELNDRHEGELIWDYGCLDDDQAFVSHLESCADTISDTPCNCPDHELKSGYTIRDTPEGISVEADSGRYHILDLDLDSSELSLDKPNLMDSIKSIFTDDKYLSNLGGRLGLAGSFDECHPKPKTTYRFCVTSSARLFDSQDASFKPVEYRFAVDFAPEPIEPYRAGAAGDTLIFRTDDMITQVGELD